MKRERRGCRKAVVEVELGKKDRDGAGGRERDGRCRHAEFELALCEEWVGCDKDA